MKQIVEGMKKYWLLILIMLLVVASVLVGIFIFQKGEIYYAEQVKEEKYFLLNQDYKTGVIDKKGNIIISPEYDNIFIPNLSKGLFICVYDYNEETGEHKTKVLNEKKEQILTTYSGISAIAIEENGLIEKYEKSVLKYKEGNLYGLVSFEGKRLTDPIYESIESNSGKEGYLTVIKDGLARNCNCRWKKENRY